MPPQQSVLGEAPSRLDPIARQSGMVMAGKAVVFCLGSVTSVVLARVLGAESLGKYQLGLVTVHVTTIFCVVGFEKGLIRYLPLLELKEPSRIRSLLASNFFITLILSLVFAAVIFVSAPYLATFYFRSEEMNEVLRTFCFYLPVVAISRVGSGAVKGSKRADLDSNVSNILSPILYLTTLLVVAFLDGGLIACIGARMTTHLAALLVLIVFLVNRYRPVPARSQGSQFALRSYLSFSTPLMLIGLIYFLLNQMDIMMLGYFVSERDVGVYAVAAKLAMLAVVGLEIFVPIIGPHFSELACTKKTSTIETLFRITAKWSFYAGLLVFSILSIMRFEVLSIFGGEFLDGTTILLILLIGQMMNTLTGPTGQLLVMTGNQRWEVANCIVVVGLNLVLNLLLIPMYGVIGAGIATALSLTAVNIIKLLEVYRLYSLSPYTLDHLKGVAGAIVGGIACYYLRILTSQAGANIYLVLALSGLALISVFVLTIWLLGLSAEDKRIGQILLQRIPSTRKTPGL